MMLAQETFNAYNSFILLAVPFFLLTANLMSVGGITDRLVALSRSIVGSFPGSLAQINVVLSVFFAGISGSSTADAASQSKIFIDAQTKEGYDLSFSVAITAVSAVLAVIIPPSILMIVWGGLISTSIGALYPRGHRARPADRRRPDGHGPRLCREARLSDLSARHAARTPLLDLGFDPGLMTPVIIVGGILRLVHRDGVGLCRGLYSAVLSIVVYREMGPKEPLQGAGRHRQARLGGAVLHRHRLGFRLAAGLLQIPQELLANVTTWGMGPIGVGFFIAFVFLVVGCFLDAIPAIIIVGTVLEPLAKVGVDGPRALRHRFDRCPGLRTRDPALWALPHDLLRRRWRAPARCPQGHDDHAGAHDRGAGGDDRVARHRAVPASPHRTGAT
jgi:TRAP-type C4-dicarboxylate transport system permease large subunit